MGSAIFRFRVEIGYTQAYVEQRKIECGKSISPF
jgi:hypothetical protein